MTPIYCAVRFPNPSGCVVYVRWDVKEKNYKVRSKGCHGSHVVTERKEAIELANRMIA